MIELETLKKKIIYRANYRGTKEMDILLSKFVDKYIDTFITPLLLYGYLTNFQFGFKTYFSRHNLRGLKT